jgi:hypothetical protein
MCQQSFADHPRLAPTAFICAPVSESIREINSSKTLSSSRASIDLSKNPVTHGSGDGRSSMRSAMTRRLFHARTVRQRKALPVE